MILERKRWMMPCRFDVWLRQEDGLARMKHELKRWRTEMGAGPCASAAFSGMTVGTTKTSMKQKREIPLSAVVAEAEAALAATVALAMMGTRLKSLETHMTVRAALSYLPSLAWHLSDTDSPQTLEWTTTTRTVTRLAR